MEATCRKCGAEEVTLVNVHSGYEKPADAEGKLRKMIVLHEDNTPTMVFNTKRMLEEWGNANAISDQT